MSNYTHQTAPTQFVGVTESVSPIADSATPTACLSSSTSTTSAPWIIGTQFVEYWRDVHAQLSQASGREATCTSICAKGPAAD